MATIKWLLKQMDTASDKGNLFPLRDFIQVVVVAVGMEAIMVQKRYLKVMVAADRVILVGLSMVRPLQETNPYLLHLARRKQVTQGMDTQESPIKNLMTQLHLLQPITHQQIG
ncbi:hypothetical protein COM64_28850 [Bacillus toyonensis]|uniref:hypothetical protein n=1 Tax=Bacillus toyonensis TaxID=155322 RepID=UPI000BF6E431|nr:hypothetical protein COM54_28160 [Bacillus toyonensis]PGE10514.1 hypothetical protein COM64_28850 [Bacillus toyonensis]